MDDEVKNSEFGDFLAYYAWDLMILCFVIFWHVLFLLGMGVGTSTLIFSKIKKYETDYAASSIPMALAWKLLLFGVLYGVTDYLAAQAIVLN